MKKKREKFNIYIDESGIACLTDITESKFILTGVILDHEEEAQVAAYFNFIKRKYGIPEDNPFHAYDLFGNRHSKFYLSDVMIQNLSISLAEFIRISPLKSLCLSIDKEGLKRFLKIKDNSYFEGVRKRDKEIPYEMLAIKILLWFGNYLNQKGKASGKIIVESRQNLDYATLKAYFSCKQENNFRTKRFRESSVFFKENVGSIGFENKIGLCGGLEIADLISYISFLSVKKQISQHEQRGVPVLWEAIKETLEKNKIQEVVLPEFKNLLSPDRVNKITNFNSNLPNK